MPMKFYSDPDNYKTWKTLVAAKYNRLDVQAPPKGSGGNPAGKIPVLETENGCIFSSNAVARYVARMRRDVGLYGQNFLENGMVDSWMEFCTHELEVPLCTWTYPIKGIFENVPEATKQAKEDVKRAMDILNKHFLVNTYMVGHQITLADICLACALVDGFRLVFDENFRKPYANLLRWFELCINQPEFQAVIGKVEYCGSGGKPAAAAQQKGGCEPKAKAEPKAKQEPKQQQQQQQQQKGGKDKGSPKAKAQPEPKQKAEPSAEEKKKAQLKKVLKEGGKRGVEIEGAADMGGLGFFCTGVDEPDGDLEMVEKCMEAMNQECDPSEEERKGGAGKIGKMIFSAGVDQLAICAHVPDGRTKDINCKEWITQVCKDIGGQVKTSGKNICTAVVPKNADKGIFPLKSKDAGITAAISYLKAKGHFPDNDSDDDEYVFGDDDMDGCA